MTEDDQPKQHQDKRCVIMIEDGETEQPSTSRKRKEREKKKHKKHEHCEDDEPPDTVGVSDPPPPPPPPEPKEIEKIAGLVDEHGIASDRFSGHKSMLPSAISDGAWRPFGLCRDLMCIAASMCRIADSLEASSGANASERMDIIAKLHTVEIAVRRTADNAHAQFVDGIASSMVRMNNSELLGDGPLIPQPRSLAHQPVHRQQQHRKKGHEEDRGSESTSSSTQEITSISQI